MNITQGLDEGKIQINDVFVAEFEGDISESKVIDLFDKNSPLEILCSIEAVLTVLLANVIIMIFILRYVDKLFNNIKNKQTPFTLDNVTYIKKYHIY